MTQLIHGDQLHNGSSTAFSKFGLLLHWLITFVPLMLAHQALAVDGYMFTYNEISYTPIRWGNLDPPNVVSIPYQTVDATFVSLTDGSKPIPNPLPSPDVVAAVENAAGAWNGISRTDLVHQTTSSLVPPDLGTALVTLRNWNYSCNPHAAIVAAVPPDVLSDFTYQSSFASNEVATTVTFYCNREIVGAFTALFPVQPGTSSNFLPWAIGNVPAGAYDLQGVLTHEFGHILGLSHRIHPSGDLYYSNETGVDPTCDSNSPNVGYDAMCGDVTAGVTWQRTPKSDDRAGISFLYDTPWSGYESQERMGLLRSALWDIIIGLGLIGAAIVAIALLPGIGIAIGIGLLILAGISLGIGIGDLFNYFKFNTDLGGPTLHWHFGSSAGSDSNDPDHVYFGFKLGTASGDQLWSPQYRYHYKDLFRNVPGTTISQNTPVGDYTDFAGGFSGCITSIHVNGQSIPLQVSSEGTFFTVHVPTPTDGNLTYQVTKCDGTTDFQIIHVTRLDLAVSPIQTPAAVGQNSNTALNFNVSELRGEVSGVTTVELRDGNTVIGDEEILVERGTTIPVSFPVQFNSIGIHHLTVSLVQTAPQDINPSNDVATFDINVSTCTTSYREDFETGSTDGWTFWPSVNYGTGIGGTNNALVHGLISSASGQEFLHGNFTLKLGSDLHAFTYTPADWYHTFSGEMRSPTFVLGSQIQLWRNVRAMGLDALYPLPYNDGYYLEVRDASTDQPLVIIDRYTGITEDDLSPLLAVLMTNMTTGQLVNTQSGDLTGNVQISVDPKLVGRSVYLVTGFWTTDGRESAFVELDDIKITSGCSGI